TSVPLVAADLNGDGFKDALTANEAQDQVVRALRQPGTASFTADVALTSQNGIRGPRNIQLADLNGDGIPDEVAANSSSNTVEVSLGLGGGGFGKPKPFAVGTNPVGITVADLNGDRSPDLIVANQGSNDVSVLFGSGTGTSWTLTPGPRLQTGQGPVAV